MCENNELKICMIMFFDENIKEYSEICCKINEFYCHKHNIDFFFSDKKNIDYDIISETNISSSYWERYPLILEYIKDYDYVIYIDTDAFFYINSKNIIDEILKNKNHNNIDFIFSQDYVPLDLNTGFFIVKKTEYNIKYLKEVLKKDVNDKYFTICKNSNISYTYDQSTMSGLYRDNFMNIQDRSLKLDYGFLQYFFTEKNIQYYDKNEWVYPPQPFVCHLAGTSKQTKLNIISNYYNKIINNEIYNA